jgi:hypothetical protein
LVGRERETEGEKGINVGEREGGDVVERRREREIMREMGGISGDREKERES